MLTRLKQAITNRLYAIGLSAAMLTIVPCQTLGQENSTDETIVLFDGSNLDHWRGYHDKKIGAGWNIDEGILKFDGSGGGDIITREKFRDFELKFEWAVTEAANSGVMYKVGLGDGAPFETGPEYQILDNDAHDDGQQKITSAAALYGMYVPADATVKPVGQWNTGKIIINGNQIQHWLNGKMVIDVEMGSDDWKKHLAESKFHDWEKFATVQTGHICLQDHGDEVWFRNITIQPISSGTESDD